MLSMLPLVAPSQLGGGGSNLAKKKRIRWGGENVAVGKGLGA